MNLYRSVQFGKMIESDNSGEVIPKEFWNEGNELLYTCQKTPMLSNYQSFNERRRTKEGDLLLTRNGTPYVFIPELNSIYSNVVQRVRIKRYILDPHFAKYALENSAIYMQGNGDIISSFNMGIWKRLQIPCPDLVTQLNIVKFLDIETTKIDNLAEELTKFKANLQLQKRSLVSECVIKGIPEDRNRAYKDSGVEWIGEIPIEWQVQKLKNVFSERRINSVEDAIHLTPSQKYGTLPQEEYIKLSGYKPVAVLSENATFKQVYKNDFISHLRSFQGGLEITNYDGKISPAYTVITPSINYEPRYLRHLFKSTRFIELLATTTSQMRDGQAIKWKHLSNLDLPKPPIDEQCCIADYLDNESNIINSLIDEIDNLINLLKNYRKSLINEVVTGIVEV